MQILYFFLVFYVGVFFGLLIGKWAANRASYTGTILVSRDSEKTVYSLVLEDYPDEIRLKKEVVFKVDASAWEKYDPSEESLNRN